MSEPRPVILDAGPCLSFCAAGKQRILHDTLTLVGELMVIAHALVLRGDEGRDVIVLIDDWLVRIDQTRLLEASRWRGSVRWAVYTSPTVSPVA